MMPTKRTRGYPWRLFWLLFAAAIFAAITFGYLYRKRGLESAMIAHFCPDFVIYPPGVAFLRFLPLH